MAGGNGPRGRPLTGVSCGNSETATPSGLTLASGVRSAGSHRKVQATKYPFCGLPKKFDATGRGRLETNRPHLHHLPVDKFHAPCRNYHMLSPRENLSLLPHAPASIPPAQPLCVTLSFVLAPANWARIGIVEQAPPTTHCRTFRCLPAGPFRAPKHRPNFSPPQPCWAASVQSGQRPEDAGRASVLLFPLLSLEDPHAFIGATPESSSN